MKRQLFLFLFLFTIVLALDKIDPATCPPQLDLVFVLDTSGSIDEVYEEQIQWIKAISNGLPIHRDAVRVAAIQYAGSPIVEFSLGSNDDKTEVIKKIETIQFQSGVTKTGLALKQAELELFTPVKGARKNASKTIVLFSDGLSIDDPNKPSNRLRDVRGVNIYVISVGTDGFVPEMQKIAGDVENVFGPSDLYRFAEQLSMDVEASRRCPNLTTTTTTTVTPKPTTTIHQRIISPVMEVTAEFNSIPKRKKVRILRRKFKTGPILREEIIISPSGKKVRRIVRRKMDGTTLKQKITTRRSTRTSASSTKTTSSQVPLTTVPTPVTSTVETPTRPVVTETSTTRKRFKILGKKNISTTVLPQTKPTEPTTTNKPTTETQTTTNMRIIVSALFSTSKKPTTMSRNEQDGFPTPKAKAFASKNQIFPTKSDCPMDLLFVVDSSGSVGSVYEKQKDFLSSILENVNTEDQSHRVAFIQFAGARLQKMERPFASFSHNEEIIKAFNNLRHFTGTTYIGAALEMALIQLESRRTNIPTIVIVLSDGFSHDDVREAATSIRRLENVEVFVASLARLSNIPTLLEISGDESRLFINEEVDFLKTRLLNRLQCDL